MARPKKIIDPKAVMNLAMVGASADQIAAHLGCAPNTIERRYGAYLKRGSERGKLRIRSMLFKLAMDGQMAALIFLAKAWCGLRENEPQDLVQNNLAIFISGTDAKQIEATAQPVRTRVKEMFDHYRPQNGNGQ
jgi:hypothetical protein